MKQYSCLLFDLDGTLLDNREAVIDAVMYTAERYLPGMFTRAELLQRFGESFDDFVASIDISGKEMLNPKEIFGTYISYMNDNQERQDRLFPFVKEGLELLRSKGYRMAIVTNKQRELTEKGLRMAEIFQLFDTIVTVDDVKEGKPSAEPLRKAMTKLGVPADEVLMIGDSKYDLLAAKAAGVKSVLLQWYGCEQPAEAVPDYIFAGFQPFVDQLLVVDTKERK